VLCLNPQDLGDVWRDILWVGEEACRGPQAEAVVQQIGARLGALGSSCRNRRIVRAWRFLNGCNRFMSAGIGFRK